jgi:glycerol-3-phosphate acyltransferase PlsY
LIYAEGLIVGLLAYLIGSINSSILVGKLWKKVDVRDYGSGNAGATNTLRTLGLGPAALVILGDVLKGVIAVLLGRIFLGEIGGIVAGISVVVGHNWPVFFQFKGGKGILTSAAVIIMITPPIGAYVMAAAVIIIALTRYVSLGSLVGAVLLPLMVVMMKSEDTNLIIFSAILAVLAIYKHRSNIKRLLNGTESKIGSKKQ